MQATAFIYFQGPTIGFCRKLNVDFGNTRNHNLLWLVAHLLCITGKCLCSHGNLLQLDPILVIMEQIYEQLNCSCYCEYVNFLSSYPA